MIYNYRCRKCGTEWEEKQSVNDEALTEHRKCGGIADRIIQNVNINTHFNGSHNKEYKRR